MVAGCSGGAVARGSGGGFRLDTELNGYGANMSSGRTRTATTGVPFFFTRSVCLRCCVIIVRNAMWCLGITFGDFHSDKDGTWVLRMLETLVSLLEAGWTIVLGMHDETRYAGVAKTSWGGCCCHLLLLVHFRCFSLSLRIDWSCFPSTQRLALFSSWCTSIACWCTCRFYPRTLDSLAPLSRIQLDNLYNCQGGMWVSV